MTIYCGTCGTANEDDKKTCKNCAKSLELDRPPRQKSTVFWGAGSEPKLDVTKPKKNHDEEKLSTAMFLEQDDPGTDQSEPDTGQPVEQDPAITPQSSPPPKRQKQTMLGMSPISPNVKNNGVRKPPEAPQTDPALGSNVENPDDSDPAYAKTMLGMKPITAADAQQKQWNQEMNPGRETEARTKPARSAVPSSESPVSKGRHAHTPIQSATGKPEGRSFIGLWIVLGIALLMLVLTICGGFGWYMMERQSTRGENPAPFSSENAGPHAH